MKSLFILLLFVLSLSLATAQVDTLHFTNFNDGLMPAAYTLINADGLTPDDPDLATLKDSAWAVRNITKQGWTSGYAAFTVSWYVNDAGPSNDWLILPKLTFRAGMKLSWSGLAITSSGTYRDQYQVYPAKGNTLTDFGDYGPIFDTGIAGELATPTWHNLNVDSALTAQGFVYGDDVYLAFRDITQSLKGNELAIDDILVTANKATALDNTNAISLSIAPNPTTTNNRLAVQFTTDKAQTVNYHFVTVNGAKIGAGTMRVQQGRNSQSLTAPTASGLYTLVLTGENFSATQKVVVE